MLAAIGHALMMSHLSTYTGSMRLALCLLFTLTALSAQAQESLRQEIRAIAIEAHGKVSVACSLPGSALNCDLNPNAQPPMQSVFKLPLAIIVLHQVERGTLSLDQPVGFFRRTVSCPTFTVPCRSNIPMPGLMSPCASFCD
jgi:beta-lactamase class A